MQTYAFFSIELTVNIILNYCKRQILLLQNYCPGGIFAVVSHPFENILKTALT